MTRHTITVTVTVEATTTRRNLVAAELLSYILNLQDTRFRSCEVLPDGSEARQTSCTLSVACAVAEGITVTGGRFAQ